MFVKNKCRNNKQDQVAFIQDNIGAIFPVKDPEIYGQ